MHCSQVQSGSLSRILISPVPIAVVTSYLQRESFRTLTSLNMKYEPDIPRGREAQERARLVEAGLLGILLHVIVPAQSEREESLQRKL